MNYYFRTAEPQDEETVIKLYQSLIGTPGCTWDFNYPSIENVQEDIKSKSLYCLCNNNGCIVAAIAAYSSEELRHISWDKTAKKPCDLARLGVLKEMHRQGLGNIILEYIINEAKKRGFDGLHLLVSKTNLAALALYDKAGFKCCSETLMY